MSAVNESKFQHAMFLFSGIPGQEKIHILTSILFCLIYVVSILGNSVILLIIKTDPKLQEPMYSFLSMLALTDLGLSISTMPTTLGILCFKSSEISHNACFAQLFFIHLFALSESSVLLCMAFDRYLAICNPLRYNSILTPRRIAQMGLVCVLRGVSLILPLPILLKEHLYCQSNILSHFYCLHAEVMNLACSDIRVNINYGFFGTVFPAWLDFLLILLSYVIILKTVLSITSHRQRLKALNTCVSHASIVILFYMSGFSSSIIYRFVRRASPVLEIAMGNVNFLFPPLVNPIVYSVRTQHIRTRIMKLLSK